MQLNPTTPRHWKTPDLTTYPPFGEWTVLRFMGYHDSNAYWECRCSCGTVRTITGNALLRNASKSCGCQRAELVRQGNTTHGMSYSAERAIWAAMIQRCTNPNNKEYARYGARGIAVCERWCTFENFYADMGYRPAKGLTLERLENSLGYFPGNVIWGTATQQALNRRSTQWVTYNNETLCLKDWAERLGISHTAFYPHLRKGKTHQEILTYFFARQK